MQLLHLDLRLIQDSTYALRCFESNPNEYDPRRLDLGEIAELLKRAETHYYTYLPDHEAMGRKLFDWLDGEDGFLRQVLARCSSGTVLAIAAGERLANLPWEVLHDGADFLVKQRVVPVRWVRGAENALSRTEEPENRPLNVLFMATDPEGQASLQFEAEEGRILQATAQFPLQLDVEESGCLTELRYTVQAAAAAFDVFHLTGHATITEAGARFATETETGDLQLASAADIAQAIRYQSALPRLVFVSGCKTGQSATTQGEGQDVALPSLAEELLGWGAGAVLGWGQKVQDDDATLAAAALYRELAAGETVVTALGQVYERLLTAEARDWHLLRLYVRGSLPGALVTPSRTRGRQRLRRRKTKEQFLDPQTRKSKVAGRESFVGRRRVLQACLRVLLQLGDEVGILLHGMGGLGKSTVARRLCDRLQDRDYKLIFWEGTLNEARLVSEIAKQVDDKALRDMVLDEPRSGEALKYRLRRLFEQLPDDEQWLLVWDDFEAGNVEPQGGGYRLTPEARQLWGAVQWAIEETGAPHRVIVTCRYQVRMAGLFEQPLASLKGSDLFKKCQQLEAFKPDSKVEEGLQARAQGLADGNPRLLEWLDKVLVAESVDAVAVIRRLETDKSDLMERVLAAELLARVAGPLRVLLSRGLIFELPVPKAALLAIAEDENAEGLIDRAVALGLLEVSPDGGLRVPRVLPLDVPEDEALAAAAARVLYGLWWEEAESSTEAQRLEVHRLAIEGKEGEIAATIANALNKNWINRSGYRDVVNLCEKTISIVENAQIFNSLARSQRELGEPEPALRNFEKALNVCTEDAESDRASILHEMAIIYAHQGQVDEAIALYQQSLEITEKIGNVQTKAATLHQMAGIYAQQGEVDEAIALYQQVLEIDEKIGNVQGKAATLAMMGQLLADARQEYSQGLAYLAESLQILVHLKSPSAQTVREIMARIEQNRG
ncbi:MAG: tetratricopeptide repeat protein [Spirulinaceae cyanobacterium]